MAARASPHWVLENKTGLARVNSYDATGEIAEAKARKGLNRSGFRNRILHIPVQANRSAFHQNQGKTALQFHLPGSRGKPQNIRIDFDFPLLLPLFQKPVGFAEIEEFVIAAPSSEPQEVGLENIFGKRLQGKGEIGEIFFFRDREIEGTGKGIAIPYAKPLFSAAEFRARIHKDHGLRKRLAAGIEVRAHEGYGGPMQLR